MQKRNKLQVTDPRAKRRWTRNATKEAFWREHIRVWKESGKSKRAYCMEHELSESSFTWWIRETRMRDKEKVTSANTLLEPEDQLKNPFVPLRLLPESQCDDQLSVAEKESPLAANAQPRVEIVLPAGAVIRFDQTCSLKFIGELFSTLKGQERC